LVGTIQIWNKDTFKLIGKNNAHCSTVCEWSPDGSQILTAVTHPRVRVDNEVKQFTYFAKKLFHRKIDNSDALYQACWQPLASSQFEKITVPEDFIMYDVEKDPKEKPSKPATTQKKGTLNLPKSSAFSSMMRAEMNSVTTVGPRKLKKDDYKQYMIESNEEKKALQAKPAPKPKAAPKASWRSNGGFKIPTKEEQKAQTEKIEEEKKLIPAPMEYKLPEQQPQPQAQTHNHPRGGHQQQNKNGQKKNNKKNRNNKKNKGGGHGGPPATRGGHPPRGRGGHHADHGAHQNNQEYGYGYYQQDQYNAGYDY
jgi:uncharacterized protein with WD repeat